MFSIQSLKDYQDSCEKAEKNSDEFWAEIASNYFWFEKWQKVSNCRLEDAKVSWFLGGKTNLSYNCLDVHLKKRGDEIAVIWESNDINVKSREITYIQLHQEVCKFANLLLGRGVKKGDRVAIYMPMIVESLVAMLACARIGAIHFVVFAGFSAAALRSRIDDCEAKVLITSDLLFRGNKEIDLFAIANEAVANSSIQEVILFKRGATRQFNCQQKLLIWQDEIAKYSSENKAAILDSEDELFILYTSGSTGKPKGILHALGGYMTYAGYSFKNVFGYQNGEVFFCSADIGWITGHSYLAYGPLLNGATILMFEGVPTYPTPSRFWQVIEKHKVNIFYTAPTAIRALMQKGNEFVDGFDLSSLRVLGSVGEPINEEAWQWFFEKIGNKKCSLVDTWWQTETGGILLSSLAGVLESKPAFAGFALPGIMPVLLDDEGVEILESNKAGNLCFKKPWPSLAKSVWGDKKKFFKTYFERFRGFYLAGDSALRDEDGLYRVIGRIDDVIKVSGHRLGSGEIENAVNLHELISESAAIAIPHDIKGEVIYIFAIVKSFSQSSLSAQKISTEISDLIVKELGAIARPERVIITSDLPKTRSGKIMRRILRKIILRENDFGDISTLVNPKTVKLIISQIGIC